MESKLLVILFSFFLWIVPVEPVKETPSIDIYLKDIKELNSELEKDNKFIEKKVVEKVEKGKLAIEKIKNILPNTVFLDTVIYDTIYSFRRF